MRIGIKAKLVLSYLCLVVVPLPLLATFIYRKGVEIIRDQTRAQMDRMAEDIANQIDLFLEARRSDTLQFAHLPGVKNYLNAEVLGLSEAQKEKENLQAYLAQFLQQYPMYERAIVLGGDRSLKVMEPRAGETAEAIVGDISDALFKLAPKTVEIHFLETSPTESSINGPLLEFYAPVYLQEPRGMGTEAAQALVDLFGEDFQQMQADGLVRLDCRLEEILAFVHRVKMYDQGHALLADRQGKLLSRASSSSDTTDRALAALVATTANQYTRRIPAIEDQNTLSTFHFCNAGKWVVGMVVPERDLVNLVRPLRNLVMAFTAILALISILLSLSLSRSFSSRIERFARAARSISAGDFATRIPVAGSDEIADLALTFNQMTGRLQQLLEDTREKERLKRELDIAHQIQMSLLPQQMPQLRDIELQVVSRPAKEVGGDYYDFILDSGRRIGLAIGDVSGKGVPAALLMSMTRSMLRTQAKTTHDPDQILQELNALVYDDVRASKNFVALLYGVVDLGSKTLSFSNAGQVSPLWFRPRERSLNYLQPGGLPLGSWQRSHYECVNVQLEAGDLILFYTDGIVEAKNAAGEMFGFDRLESTLVSIPKDSAETVLRGLLSAVEEFQGTAEQNDDITLVVLRVV